MPFLIDIDGTPVLPTEPFTFPTQVNEFAALQQAIVIADRSVIADIQSEGHLVHLDGRAWYDTRPMTDPREHAPPVVDMASEAIAYAVARRLASVHPQRPYLLSIPSGVDAMASVAIRP